MVKKFGINPEETIYIEDIAKDKNYISHKIENLSLFLKEIRLLKSK